MKTTFLAWTAQRSDIFTEEQRMVQGHHKSQKSSSLRRYSRDDVYPQLQLQASLTTLVQSGWRPALAQHRGAQSPMVEPEVLLERFRKDHEPLTWKRFQFSATPKDQSDHEISLIHETSEEMQADQSDSSSESDSSSSSSSSNRLVVSASKPSKEDFECSEEIFVGWTTHIQHAVRVDPSPKPGTPRFDGIAWRSMCGARLNPLMKFSDQPNQIWRFVVNQRALKRGVAWNLDRCNRSKQHLRWTWIGHRLLKRVFFRVALAKMWNISEAEGHGAAWIV